MRHKTAFVTTFLPPKALHRSLAILLLWIGAFLSWPVSAEVVATFWSQELGRNFPHAFFTLHGARADGTSVRASYGFTPKALTPAVFFGTVPGRVDETTDRYISRSNAHFSVAITDAQHAAIMGLVTEWGENGDQRGNPVRAYTGHCFALGRTS